MNRLFDLTHRVAVVTGGAGTLGKAFSKILASAGAKVFIAEKEVERAKDLTSSLRAEFKNIEVVMLDISSEASIMTCIEDILKATGRIDVWINNAYPRTDDWHLPLEKIPFASWKKNVDDHLNGYCWCARYAAETMKREGKGSIINIGSTYGIVGPDFSIYEGTQMTMPAAYAAIKGGIIQFTRYLASWYGTSGVRVNTISPGGIEADQPQSFKERYIARTLLKRMAKAEDIAGAALFLASDASLYVTGHNLVVDGGWSAI